MSQLSSDSQTHPAETTVLVGVQHVRNRRLLTQFLRPRDSAGGPLKVVNSLEQQPDLVIVDRAGLARLREPLLEHRRAVRPLLLPVLLTVSSRDLDRERVPEDLVEDVIVAPVRKAEFGARMRTLLRLRLLSSQQQSARETAEQKLEIVTRAYRAFTTCNEVVIRAKQESECLAAVCRAIVDEAGFPFAWVGYARDGSEGFDVKAEQVRDDHARQRSVALGSKGGPERDSLVAHAASTGEAYVRNDLAADRRQSPWRDAALPDDFASAIALPLRVNAEVIGGLAIYSDEPNAFTASEVRLLTRMSENLAYGIQALRNQLARQRKQAQAAYLAYRDALTGLANRTWMTEALERLSRSGQRSAALLFLDLDGFKIVNDARGHDTGDALLKQVAQRLERVVRSSDLVARQGGDEFLVLMPYQPRDDEPQKLDEDQEAERLADAAATVSSRILQMLRSPFVVDGQEHYLAGSLGISLYPRDTLHGPDLLSQADNAMYQAKRRGGDCYHFYSQDLTEAQRRRLALERGLHKAVEENAFELHFQRVIDVQAGTTVELEALIRWRCHDGRLVSPGEFLPVAEQTGLIVPVGQWVLRKAMDTAQALRRAGIVWRIWVNLSVAELRNPQFVEDTLGIVSEFTSPNELIGFEVTESAVMRDPKQLEATLEALRHHGFPIAMDDFGTGYSSLSRLWDFPFTRLKIDKSFLQRASDNSEAATLVGAIVNLAQSLDLDVVAEGVEQESEFLVLREQRCDFAQGFLFNRPEPIGTLLEESTHTYD